VRWKDYPSLARRQRAGVLRKWLTVDWSGLLAGLLWKASVVVRVRLILRLRWIGLEGVVEQVLHSIELCVRWKLGDVGRLRLAAGIELRMELADESVGCRKSGPRLVVAVELLRPGCPCFLRFAGPLLPLA
jgi:hypothetical protein